MINEYNLPGDTGLLSDGLKKRDLGAYRDLFFRYHGRLVLFAFRFTGEMEVARDIVQDTFLNLWEKADNLNIETSVKAYLFQAVRNRSLNFFRYQSTRHNVHEELTARIEREEQKIYADEHNPFHSLLELELEQKVKDVVDSLPERCREVFELSRYHDLKNREIAEKMDISVKMVEKHISHALRVLRSELANYFNILIFFFLQLF
ncbi:MAG: RNA polymerase sigma-70 factor [Mangrovibacterium sp.]